MSKSLSENLSVFKETVGEHFQFLVEDYGFSFLGFQTDSGVSCRYESRKVFIQFHYYPPGFEIDILLGRKGKEDVKEGNPFYFQEVLSFLKKESTCGFMACSVDNVKSCIPILGKLLKEVGDSFLNGVDEDYKNLSFYRNAENNRYAIEQELKQTRKLVEDAWRDKEYRKVIELFSPLQEWLNPTEVKKLEYARKHIM